MMCRVFCVIIIKSMMLTYTVDQDSWCCHGDLVCDHHVATRPGAQEPPAAILASTPCLPQLCVPSDSAPKPCPLPIGHFGSPVESKQFALNYVCDIQ